MMLITGDTHDLWPTLPCCSPAPCLGWRGDGSPGKQGAPPGCSAPLSRRPTAAPGAGGRADRGGPGGGGGGRAAARRGADISRRRGLPASFFARCITSRRCHTPLPGAGLQPRLPPPRRAAGLGGAGAHGVPARRGQPPLCRPQALLEVSGAGAGARPRGNPAPDPPGRPRSCARRRGQRDPRSPAAPRREGGAGTWRPPFLRGGSAHPWEVRGCCTPGDPARVEREKTQGKDVVFPLRGSSCFVYGMVGVEVAERETVVFLGTSPERSAPSVKEADAETSSVLGVCMGGSWSHCRDFKSQL